MEYLGVETLFPKPLDTQPQENLVQGHLHIESSSNNLITLVLVNNHSEAIIRVISEIRVLPFEHKLHETNESFIRVNS